MADLGSYTSAAAVCFLTAVLVRAALHKWQNYPETVGFAQGYGLVPDTITPAIVRFLAVIEPLIVVGLLLPLTREGAALAAAGLFAGYGVLMTLALRAGRDRIDCGCGGAPQIVSGLTLGRNAVLVLIALSVALLPSGTVGPAGAAVAIATGLTFFAIYSVVEKLASHLPNIRQTP